MRPQRSKRTIHYRALPDVISKLTALLEFSGNWFNEAGLTLGRRCRIVGRLGRAGISDSGIIIRRLVAI